MTTTYDYGATPAMGLPLTETDSLGHVTHYTYDPRGNQLSVTDAVGLQTMYSYDLANDQTQMTLSRDRQRWRPRRLSRPPISIPAGPKSPRPTTMRAATPSARPTTPTGPKAELLGRTGSAEPVTYAYDGSYRVLADGWRRAHDPLLLQCRRAT